MSVSGGGTPHWALLLLLCASCSSGEMDQAGSTVAVPVDSTAAAPVNRVDAAFRAVSDPIDNLYGAAAWRRADDSVWLLASAEAAHALLVFDGVSGTPLSRFGTAGAGAGQLRGPRGLFVDGDLLLVVEGENKRIQAFRLPDFQPLGTLGEDVLQDPYDITGYRTPDRALEIYVTDKRVQHFRVTNAPRVRAQQVNTFGDTLAPGAHIRVDDENGRLLLAKREARDIEIYSMDGVFTGATIGTGVFDAVGAMALWGCNAEGYWLAVDSSRFQVFDRATLRHVGTFAANPAEAMRGVTLLSGPVGPLPGGALYALQGERSIAAFAWHAVAEALELRVECTERE